MTGDRRWPACFNPFHSPKSKSRPCFRLCENLSHPKSSAGDQSRHRVHREHQGRLREVELGSQLWDPWGAPLSEKWGNHLIASLGFTELRMQAEPLLVFIMYQVGTEYLPLLSPRLR